MKISSFIKGSSEKGWKKIISILLFTILNFLLLNKL